MKKLFLVFISLSMALLYGCSTPIKKEPEPVKQTSFVLNTVASITVYDAQDNVDKANVIEQCFDLCRDYENMLSRTIKGSDIDNINNAHCTPVTVTPQTAELIEKSLFYSNLSNGAFDITIAPLSSLWDFQSEEPTVPDYDLIQDHVKLIDYTKLSVKENQVTLQTDNGAIDLGGIAKGYIADKAAEFLEEKGVTSAIINLGGNIYALGENPNGKPFNIGIQNPFHNQNDVLGSVAIKNKSVVTSGIYERYFKVGDKIYHHILDPKTGYPIENDLFSVTIISDKSVDGDALSTSCFVLGLEKGLELINSLDGIDAIFITNDNTAHFSDGIGSDIDFTPYEP